MVAPSRDVGLLDAVVRNHALVDGNKRLGWSSVVVFYDLNGVDRLGGQPVASQVCMGKTRPPSSAHSPSVR